MAEEKTKEEKPKPQPPSKRRRCCKCLFWTFSILVAIAAILAGVLWRLVSLSHTEIPVEVVESIGDDGIQLFFQHDRDGDGYLSLTEYETLYLLLKGHGTNVRGLDIPSITNEPEHGKTNKMTCAPIKDSDQLGHPHSLIRVFYVCLKKP